MSRPVHLTTSASVQRGLIQVERSPYTPPPVVAGFHTMVQETDVEGNRLAGRVTLSAVYMPRTS